MSEYDRAWPQNELGHSDLYFIILCGAGGRYSFPKGHLLLFWYGHDRLWLVSPVFVLEIKVVHYDFLYGSVILPYIMWTVSCLNVICGISQYDLIFELLAKVCARSTG